MCGIFGALSKNVKSENIKVLAKHAEQRGRDSSGLSILYGDKIEVLKADFNIMSLISKARNIDGAVFVAGHSRLVTNGHADNQPVVRDDVIVIHNGIIVNEEEIWGKVNTKRTLAIDTETINAIVNDIVSSDGDLNSIPNRVLGMCKGVVACAVILPKKGKVFLFSNNGSLYVGENNQNWYFSSEKYPLETIECTKIQQVFGDAVVWDIPVVGGGVLVKEFNHVRPNLVPSLILNHAQEGLLEFVDPGLKRCTKCILPETMPFIHFDSQGVCNYCHSYKKRNIPKPKEELFELVAPYRRGAGQTDCIVPFSGGRDSCYALHLIVNELKMKPVTYTYDWGMVTDLGRRNISRMSSILGVENIIVAADITQKRKNIKRNLEAWLKSPHLGMMSILTAGDKHFFRHVETVKEQTGIGLNLWGVNPLEVTHFKTGFLNIPPDFESKKVYTHGVLAQLRYQAKRFGAMCESPSYFNSSLWDTLSGEYYRSFTEKSHYYHLFDYWRWDEKVIDDTLLNKYDWEKAPDTSTTWRIGDGTAAFYNYVYYTVAGFTEHDTFRSNQIREGDISREEALALVMNENRPRYPNIRWYLDVLGLDFDHVIKVVNSIPKMYVTKK
ncbi:Amidophosphoribosyltransferase [Bdellovibrio bacteriovorus]|uniref:glucosamine 6-phosphate synthetase n=1 Tax=Bdellovibrio bacteriovorus TaxID=959 RepID=UPI00045C0D59|nr:glucosamine 6-phosphate synthetase [Bdellovibrio bacteriovorus]AHZ84221.1 glucosamine 6-phosphate synthetase [Bdellovibrio bacteriovorus]BEV68106.1 Amidophosphoribosyltransferase [Bdellovibrio bacteriovorus]